MLDDELICVRDPFNSIDRYAVTVKNGDTVVEHLPKKISRLYSLFLMKRRKHCVHCHWKEEVFI